MEKWKYKMGVESMKLLVIKKDRLEELNKFGFIEDGGFYTYCGTSLAYQYTVRVSSFWEPIITISEYDNIDNEESTTTYIPEIVMELIEEGMVERYEDS